MENVYEEVAKNVLPNANSKVCCGPISSNLSKLAAHDCFAKGNIEAGIYHLTESHAIGYRSQILSHIGQMNSMQAKYLSVPNVSFDPELIDFTSDYASENEKGLMKRLEEMPEEWTLVQLTQGFSSKTRCFPREAGTPSVDSVLHITRFSCGRNTRKPCYRTLPKGNITAEKMSAVFDVIESSLKPSTKNMTPSKLLREMVFNSDKILPAITCKSKPSREDYSQKLKLLVDEINFDWLQHWRCLFLGQLCSNEMKHKVRKTVDSVLNRCKSKLGANEVSLLYQIADGSGHLEDREIEAAVSDCIHDEATCNAMIEAVKEFKSSYLNLAVAKRYPVLLILDEILDRIPWEVIPVLRRHPVSRIFSVHFAHAIYKNYKQKLPMKDGCFLLKKSEKGYFVINPDKDLKKTQKKMSTFLSSRVSSWDGTTGSFPSNDEFSSALTEHTVLLYCGHGNGTQYFSSESIVSLKVKAVPLLFGCSSVKMNDFGGRVRISGLAMKYLTAGSPCVLGMLWKVTSNDADNMCLAMLNNWLPGEAINIADFISGAVEITNRSEPELLRNLKLARESCVYYTNAAALVVYGIPVTFS